MFREFHHQVKGKGHVETGSPCQDKTSYTNREGVQVLCLSDGAGSAAHSEIGAQALVNEGGKMLVEQFVEFTSRDDGANVKVEVVQRLLTKLERTSRRRKVTVKDLAATFLAVAVSGDRFIAIHIGDGVIGYEKDGELKVVSAPDNSEFANQTTFVTSLNAAHSMRLLRGSTVGVTGFVLMSDGTENSLYNYQTQKLAPACSKIIALVAASSRGLSLPSVRYQLRRFLATKVKEATKDDCSLAVFGRSV